MLCHGAENLGRRRGCWLIAALAALCGVLGMLAILAPVEVNDPVITWPQAGQEPTSTLVPLAPYRPLQLDVTVPCRTLAALDPAGVEALRTLPADAAFGQDQGLVVSSSGGRVRVVASGSTVLEETIPGSTCSYRVQGGADGVAVSRDGTELTRQPALLVPEVAELVTDAQGAAATAGLSVRLHTDARYQSSPSALKLVLLVAHALSLLALLIVGWRVCGGRTRRDDRHPGLIRPRLALPDALVVAVSGAWAFLGPVNIDDSWYLLMARNAQASGYVSNYINMFNSSENPFVLSQYLMQGWGSLGGWGLLWMRLLPVMYGLATYALLRLLLATVLGRGLQDRRSLRRRAPWALAIAHLLWWLPYGITLRPEPLIVLFGAAVLLLAELARQRRSVGVLAVATAVAALALTVSPTALVAAVPLVLNLPWLWRWLRAAGWRHRIGAIGLLLAATTAIVPVGFGDATLGDVLEATAIRTYYYLRYPWYDEFRHYESLMEGTWLVRLPVLLTLAVLGAALIAAGPPRGSGGAVSRAIACYATITVLALLALSPTPSKWVNHFGSIAAPATMLLALALLRTPIPRRARVAAGTIGAGLAIAAAAAGFAGPNGWRPFSDWGQPFGNHLGSSVIQVWSTAPQLGPLQPSSPLLWLIVAGLALWWVHRRRGRGGRPGLTEDRGVLTVAATVAVVLALYVFTYAPLEQYPGPSVASVNASSAVGSGCGLAPHVQVTADGRDGTAAQLLDGHPVFVDQVAAALFPCANLVVAENGMVQTPQYTVRVGDGLEAATQGNAYIEANGGAFSPVSRTATFTELPSRLNPEGRPTRQWGHVSRVTYSHPVGLFDVQVGTVQRSGWQRLPTLAVKAYTGRDNSATNDMGP